MVKRVGQVIKLRSGKLEKYKELHAAVWPGVLKTIEDCNIRNYSIFYKDEYLFAYFEYVGDDYEADIHLAAFCALAMILSLLV